MKFVTVMDMWLLLINIGMMGGLIYLGRRLLKTMSRLIHIGEAKIDNSERRRCIDIIELEISHYRAVNAMHSDPEADQVVHTLEYILEQIRKGK
jgi:hypothetical protein